MPRHRFREQLAKQEREVNRPNPCPQGFMACPAALTLAWQGQPCPWEEVYRVAFAKAQAVVRPSRLERYARDLLN